ncbi:hypothetical protein [Rhodococcus phenolicus]|uniref:hypothetical protein n=1 Tax=Rhodococcus phenolicus TaxID=263849 RepID=UPI0012E7A583|nr:hypothetical protein [Rhodococcus phenolicus]
MSTTNAPTESLTSRPGPGQPAAWDLVDVVRDRGTGRFARHTDGSSSTPGSGETPPQQR